MKICLFFRNPNFQRYLMICRNRIEIGTNIECQEYLKETFHSRIGIRPHYDIFAPAYSATTDTQNLEYRIGRVGAA